MTNNKTITRKEFFDREYQSNSYSLIDDAYQDIASLCEIAYIDPKDAIDNLRVEYSGSHSRFYAYTKRSVKATAKKYFGRNEIYAQLKEYRDPDTGETFDLPFINVVLKQADMGTWSGAAHFNRRYHEYIGTEISKAEQERRKKQAEIRNAKAEQRKRDAIISELISQQAEQERLLGLLTYQHQYNAAPNERGFDPYLTHKGVADIAQLTELKQVPAGDYTYDQHGNPCLNDSNKKADYWPNKPFPQHLAIPFYQLQDLVAGVKDLIPVAWQRIYEDKPGKFKKMQTRALTRKGRGMTGAAHVIGQLTNGCPILVGEGFATVASGILANGKFSGVVAYSASNLKVIVPLLRQLFPDSQIVIMADNDHETCAKGKGNAGILAVIDILKKNFKRIAVQVPKFKNGKGLSDFNDIHTAVDIDEVKRQLKSPQHRLTLEKNSLFRELQVLRYVANGKIESQLRRIVSAGSVMIPSILNQQQLFEAIRSELLHISKHRDISIDNYLEYAKNRIEWLHRIRTARAQEQRSFSRRITDKKLRPDHISYRMLDHWKITTDVVDLVRSLDGPVILRAGMASGKSSECLKPLIREFETAICAAHRISLMDDLWSVMSGGDRKKKDFQSDILHYKDLGAAELAPHAKKLVVCINSIIKGIFRPLVNNHQFLALDEATQVLSSIISGGAMAYPVQVYQILKQALACTSEKILLADADANDNLVELLELANDERESLGLPRWPKIHVIELPVNIESEEKHHNAPSTFHKIRVNHTDPNSVYYNMIECARKGEKFLLATDSTKMATQLVNEIETVINPVRKEEGLRPLRVLYVSQDTKPEASVQVFQSNPSQECLKYDVLIYSPSISSGVSMKTKHFEKHFAVFYGEVLPSNAIQMLRRDRTATNFMLGLGCMGTRRETNLTKMVNGLIQAQPDAMQCSVTQNGDFKFASHDTEFNRLRMKMLVQENRARNDFANNMLLILEDDGYIVSPLGQDDSQIMQAKLLRKAANQRIDEHDIKLHESVQTPTAVEREELLKEHSLTEQQRAMLNRYTIENEFLLPVNEQTIRFHHEGGMKKVARFELLQMPQKQADEYDAIERKTIFKYTLKMPFNNFPVTYQVVADTLEQADKERLKIYPNGEVVKCQQAPITEIVNRKYASLNSKMMRQFLVDCGIDPVTGQGEATQEAMQQAMNNLITDENGDDIRDMFNNVCDFGGRIDIGQRKRPADLLKLFADQIGVVAQNRRLERRSKGGGTVWFIDPDSWANMQKILANRKAHKLTCFDTNELVSGGVAMIHDLHINYKDHNEVMDHEKDLQPTPTDKLESALHKASSLIGLPLKWVEKTFTRDDVAPFIQGGKLAFRHFCATVRDIYLQEPPESISNDEFRRLRGLSFTDITLSQA